MDFRSGNHTQLELFARGGTGVSVISRKGGKVFQKPAGTASFELLRFPLEQNQEYEIELGDAELSLCYLCGNDDLFETGVCFLEAEDGTLKRYTKSNLNAVYNTPLREQYHFQAFRNWINDPNGLCWYQGYYHMYYQYNPHSQQWNNMYWGHAVSRDLIHWTHLPVALMPGRCILENPDLYKGGAFSGCAVALEDRIVFYLTRHIGPWEDSPTTIETQVMTESADTIHFSHEQTIIPIRPKSDVSFHFRDPKVFHHEGIWKLVLASKIGDIPSMLLYGSEDMTHWNYIGPAVQETEPGIVTFECPDLFELDGKFVAAGALMDHTDRFGRFRSMRYYIGDLVNNRLEVEHTGLYDFGTNFYAVQSFEHDGRRIAVGWVNDPYEEHVEVTGGANGSMAIPRELSVKNGILYIKPVQEIYSLLDQCLADCARSGVVVPVPGNSYLVRIRLSTETDFHLTLAKTDTASIALVRDNGVTELKTAGTASGDVRFPAPVDSVETIEIFYDRRTCEVFLNDGQAAGTRIFYCDSVDGQFSATFRNPEAVESLRVDTMKSIW